MKNKRDPKTEAMKLQYLQTRGATKCGTADLRGSKPILYSLPTPTGNEVVEAPANEVAA